MFSIFNRRLDLNEQVEPIKHIRGDGKTYWQPRLVYFNYKTRSNQEQRLCETRYHDFGDLIYRVEWVSNTERLTHQGPRLYSWRWYARWLAIRRRDKFDHLILMEIREADE